VPVSQVGLTLARPAPSGCCRRRRPSAPALPPRLTRKIRPAWRIWAAPGYRISHVSPIFQDLFRL